MDELSRHLLDMAKSAPTTRSMKSSVLRFVLDQPWFRELSGEERDKVVRRICPQLETPYLEDPFEFEPLSEHPEKFDMDALLANPVVRELVAAMRLVFEARGLSGDIDVKPGFNVGGRDMAFTVAPVRPDGKSSEFVFSFEHWPSGSLYMDVLRDGEKFGDSVFFAELPADSAALAAFIGEQLDWMDFPVPDSVPGSRGSES